MKKILLILVVSILAGCGEKVEIPPAHVGRILTPNGFAPDILPPSKFRLSPCWAYCDDLVLLEASDVGFKETIQLFMPKDKLNLTVEIRGTRSVPTNNKILNMIYDRVVSVDDYDISEERIITNQSVYKTYGEQAVRGIVRSQLVKHTIGEILLNRESIGQSIHAIITKKLKQTGSPIIISRFQLANVQPPKIIVMAQVVAKEREIDIQKAEADAKIKLVEAERNLEVAKKQRLVDKEKALSIAEQNQIAAASVTEKLLAYRKLEAAENIMKALAKNNNAVFVPMGNDITQAAVFSKLIGKEFKK
jgi:hypothetical protein